MIVTGHHPLELNFEQWLRIANTIRCEIAQPIDENDKIEELPRFIKWGIIHSDGRISDVISSMRVLITFKDLSSALLFKLTYL